MAGDSAGSAGFVRPTWADFYDIYIRWPIIVQVVLSILMFFLGLAFEQLHQKTALKTFIARYIGRVENPKVERPFFVVVCCLLQLVLSSASVFAFLRDTYHSADTDRTSPLLRDTLAWFFTFQYFLLRFQAGFRMTSCFTLDAMVDVLTVVPMFAEQVSTKAASASWLSLKYLRVFRALQAFELLNTTVELDVSPWALWAFGFFLRTIAMVISMGGTIFVLEVLGEVPGMEDKGVPTAMNEDTKISMFQMLYWIITTISTVGYGDFAPQTAPSRVTVIVFIFAGVFFFGQEINSLSALRDLLDSGRGRYVRSHRPHVVLTGSGVAKMSSMLQILLIEILDPESGHQTPNVVLLSEEPYDPELKGFVKTALPTYAQARLHFLRGSTMSVNDLQRVQLSTCRMAVIIPDITVSNPLTEDSTNILRAMEMRRTCPSLRLRLMLLEKQSEALAQSLGVPRQRAFNANGLKANLLADSARVRGIVPFLGGLFQCATPNEMQSMKSLRLSAEYVRSTGRMIYGLVIGERFVGMRLAEAAAEVHAESGGGVLLIAAQVEGHVQLNWAGQLEDGMVVLAIAASSTAIRRFAKPKANWKTVFTEARVDALVEAALTGSRAEGDPEEVQVLTKSSLPSTFRISDLDSAATSGAGDAELPSLESVDALRKHPSLVVLILMGGDELAWQHASSFVQKLREPHLAYWQPVVVISSTQPPPAFAQKYAGKRVAAQVAPLHKSHLERAGLRYAETVVVMRSPTLMAQDGGGAIVMADHEVVALHGLIESCEPAGGRRRTIIYEFGSTNAVHLLKQHRGRRATRPHRFSGPSRSKSSTGRQSSPGDGSSGEGAPGSKERVLQDLDAVAEATHAAARRSDTFLQVNVVATIVAVSRYICNLFQHGFNSGAAFKEAMNEALIMQQPFAAGEVISPDFFGGMLGHMFHFPATIEFMECLTNPADNDQSSYLWQLRCPAEWVGKSYGELVQSWLRGTDPKMDGCGPAVVIALHREQMDSEDVNEISSYNYTLPEASCELNEQDLLTVLGNQSFGARAIEMRDEQGCSLLVGARPDADVGLPLAPSKEETTGGDA